MSSNLLVPGGWFSIYGYLINERTEIKTRFGFLKMGTVPIYLFVEENG